MTYDSFDKSYLELLSKVISKGDYVEDRTGTGCYSLFGETLRVDLSKSQFPLLTTKKINFSNIVGELLFFLSGETNLKTLRHYSDKPEGAHTIWSDDAKKYWEAQTSKYNKKNLTDSEELGEIYSKQWRNWHVNYDDHCGLETHDQIQTLLDNIKAVREGDPTTARRLRVSSWNPYDHTVGDKQWCALPACHTDFQVILRGNTLNLAFTMRSSDVFLGLPYNIASYALLAHILARLTGCDVGELVYFGVDIHLYQNHIEQAKEQLSRKPYHTPYLVMPEFDTLEELLELTAKDFVLPDYKCHDFIKAPQAS